MKAMMLGWVAVTMLGAGSAEARHLVIRGPGDFGSAELVLRDAAGAGGTLGADELALAARADLDEALDSALLLAQNDVPPAASPAPRALPAAPRGPTVKAPPAPPAPPAAGPSAGPPPA